MRVPSPACITAASRRPHSSDIRSTAPWRKPMLLAAASLPHSVSPGVLVALVVVLACVQSVFGVGLLTVIAGSLYDRKDEIRRQVAFGYGLMASLQLAVLFIVQRPQIQLGLWLALPVVAATMFLIIGRRLFSAAQQGIYRVGLT